MRLSKGFCSSHVQKEGFSTCHTRSKGSHQRGWRQKMDKNRAQAMAFVAVSTGKAKQGTPNSSGLARLNYASRLQDIAAVSRCWVPGPRIIQVQGNSSLLCENQIRRHLGTSRIGCFIQLTFEQHDLNCMDPLTCWRWKWQPTPVFLPRGAWWAAVHSVAQSQTQLK